MRVSTTERIDEQLRATGIMDVLGHENVYRGDERVGAALARAEADARAWVTARQTDAARAANRDEDPAPAESPS